MYAQIKNKYIREARDKDKVYDMFVCTKQKEYEGKDNIAGPHIHTLFYVLSDMQIVYDSIIYP